jgi:concanavalin A-like lectin/glucanase superfamily protein/putative Ig domain-containing protein
MTSTSTAVAANAPPLLANPGNQTTAIPAGYAAAVQADAPVQYLRLGESSGVSAVDSSGYGRTATYHGAIAYGQSGAVGDSTTGLGLTGSAGAYVDAGPAAFTIGPDSLSIETWMATTVADGAVRYVADNTGGGANAGVSLMLQNGRAIARVGNGTTQYALSGRRADLNDGIWHHLVIVLERYYDGVHDRLAIYVDGVLDNAEALPATGWNVTSTRNVELGRQAGSDGLNFIGALDEWAIYDVALSAAQIASHFARRTPPATHVALTLTATDPDGNALTYSATGLPSSLSINPASGLISGTLAAGDAGVYTVTAVASDGVRTASQTFTWTITAGGS